jgi:hypothetical protein
MSTFTDWPSTRALCGDTDNVAKNKEGAWGLPGSLGTACADGIQATTVAPATATTRRARLHRAQHGRLGRIQEFGCDPSPIPPLTKEA